jgi:hypothetical protein
VFLKAKNLICCAVVDYRLTQEEDRKVGWGYSFKTDKQNKYGFKAPIPPSLEFQVRCV